MSRSEILSEINATIDQIRACCHHVDDSLDASYVANCVETWLDQLRSEIRDYDDAESEEM